MNAVQVNEVSKRFRSGTRSVQALERVSLAVPRGEVYGLLGRNGAGKTTLIKILLDMVRPTQGEALLLEQSASRAETRRRVGYLPEDHRFVEYQTAENALHFYARLSNVPRRVRRRRVPELLELVGLADSSRRKVRTYSKGMKQRLGLAQALVHDPELLILDEPTDGVDPVGRADIRKLLELLRSQGKTIFLNSHLLSEVELVCDRIGILEGGRLVREDTVDGLTSTSNLYTIQTFPAPPAPVLASLCSLVDTLSPLEDGIEIALLEGQSIDHVVDTLRAARISIRGLLCKRVSLEDAFLSTILMEERSV